MFQSDAGSACSIEVTENGNIPVQILIDREHEFGMFLVITQRQEQWKTSGKFHLRFVRRTPLMDKRCTARMANGPVPCPSGSSTDSTEEPGPSIDRLVSADEGDKEQEVVDRVTGANSSLAAQTPSHTLFEDAYSVPLGSGTESSESNEESTDEEDHQAIGAVALRGIGGVIIPPGMFPHTQ